MSKQKQVAERGYKMKVTMTDGGVTVTGWVEHGSAVGEPGIQWKVQVKMGEVPTGPEGLAQLSAQMQNLSEQIQQQVPGREAGG